jgi:phosphomannomutase
MAATGAIFGGEHSAHYYFKDFFGADNGMLAAMHILREFGSQAEPLSVFARKFDPYFSSGELNFNVETTERVMASIRTEFLANPSDDLDGLTIFSDEKSELWWWFNLRASNTEPLLRLNVESNDFDTCELITQRVRALISGYQSPRNLSTNLA